MTPEQIKLVQQTFDKRIWPVAYEVAAIFYERLFALDPDLKSLFTNDPNEQWRKLMEMLWTMVHGLDEIDELEPLLENLGERHADCYQVRPEYYDTMQRALLWMLEKSLENDFTDEVRAAWLAVYAMLTRTMKQAA